MSSPPGTLVRPPEGKKEDPPSIQAAAGELLLGYPEEIQEVPFLISGHGEVVKVQEHTEGSGAAPSIVFSGLGYLDVDYRDGSWRRLMDDVMDAFWRASPIASRREWFDVYYVEWVDGSRNRYYCPELADRYMVSRLTRVMGQEGRVGSSMRASTLRGWPRITFCSRKGCSMSQR